MREEPSTSDDAYPSLNLTTYSLSDGSVFIRASGDNGGQVLLSCEVSEDRQMIDELVDPKHRTTGVCSWPHQHNVV